MKRSIFTAVLALSVAAMAQTGTSTGAATGTTGTPTSTTTGTTNPNTGTSTGTIETRDTATQSTNRGTAETTTGTATKETTTTGTATGSTTGTSTGTTTGTTTGATTGTTGSTAGTSTVAASGAVDTTITTDGQIAKVLMTVDEAEMDAAEIALKRAKNKEVRSFAKMMVKHHRENKNKTKNIVKASDRDATALSKSLKQEAKDAGKNLKKESRDSFDMAYIQLQIDMHQKALNLLDSNLIPNAKSEGMRSHLMSARETVSGHLTEAQNLKTKIE